MELAGHSLADAAVMQWAYTTIANIKFAPLIAVYDALQTAEHNPRSLIIVRKDLHRHDPERWKSIACGRVLQIAERGLRDPKGNIARRVYSALSRQGVASHLQSILTEQERKGLAGLLQVFHAAARVRPLGTGRISEACSKAERTRCKNAFGQIARSSQPALAFLTADEWLSTDPAVVSHTVFVRVLGGDPKAMETMALMRGYPPSDWRWRFLFGVLMA